MDFNVSQNVTLEEAKRRHLETPSSEVGEWHSEYGLRRYITYRTLEYPERFGRRLAPGHWTTSKCRCLTELWHLDIESFERASVELAGKYTPPPGGRNTIANWQMTLATRIPKYDLLREMPKLA